MKSLTFYKYLYWIISRRIRLYNFICISPDHRAVIHDLIFKLRWWAVRFACFTVFVFVKCSFVDKRKVGKFELNKSIRVSVAYKVCSECYKLDELGYTNVSSHCTASSDRQGELARWQQTGEMIMLSRIPRVVGGWHIVLLLLLLFIEKHSHIWNHHLWVKFVDG